MNPTARKHDPRRLALPAATLSLLVPGVGHFLLGLRLRGAIWLGGFFLLVSTASAAGAHYTLLLGLIVAADAYLMARTLDSQTEGDRAEDLTNTKDRR